MVKPQSESNKGSKKRSLLWYVPAVFFQIIGGLVVYYKLRKSDATTARNSLFVGIMLSVVTIVVVVFLYGSFQADMAVAQSRIAKGSQIIDTSFGPIEYADVGHGYPVLVVHGAGGGYDQGIILANILLDGNSYRVIAPSRFGYLHTPVPDTTNNKSSFAAQADAYANLLDKLNIKKVAVLGFSAGGPSSIEFVLRHPDKTSVLVLASAVVHKEPPMGPMDYVIHYGLFKSDFAFWLIAKYFQPSLLSFFGVNSEEQANIAPAEKSWLSSILIPSMFPISQRQPGMVNDRSNFALINYPLEQISAPTLVIHAKDDTLVSPSHSLYAVQKIPNAKHIEFATGGHLLMGHHQEIKSEIGKFFAQRHAMETRALLLSTFQRQIHL